MVYTVMNHLVEFGLRKYQKDTEWVYEFLEINKFHFNPFPAAHNSCGLLVHLLMYFGSLCLFVLILYIPENNFSVMS